MARAYRYVNDHGEIFRMTETRYQQYLLAGTQEKFPSADEFGACIGTAITVNNFTQADFSAEFKREHYAFLAKVYANVCPICEAAVGSQCLSMQARWQNPMSRVVGVGDNGWRKTPHPERVQLAKEKS